MSEPAEQIPEIVGSYTVLRKIGRGGMGDVYEAVQAHPQRHVALKLIRPDKTSQDHRQQFLTEVQALGRLRHSGIARIYEGGYSADGRPYFAMELVEGLPLDLYVSTNRPSLRRSVSMLVEISAAVHHAHEREVVHCDLKPANVVLEKNGAPRILDFGVARILTPSSSASLQGGTIQYMSPEQLEGNEQMVDHRSDIYALGIMAFQILGGRLPYHLSENIVRARTAIRTTTPPSLRSLDPRVARDIDAIVAKALRKDPDQRYQSAAEFGEDLRRAAHGQLPSVGGQTFGERIERLLMREEYVRQAGWFGVAAASLVVVWIAIYAVLALLDLYRWADVFPPYVRPLDLFLNTTGWALLLSALAYVSTKVIKRSVVATYSLFGAALTLVAFTMSVVLGYNTYDGGGILNDPVFRVGTYLLLALTAFASSAIFLLAIMALRMQKKWDEPVVALIATESMSRYQPRSVRAGHEVREILAKLLDVQPSNREQWLQDRLPDNSDLRRRLIGAVAGIPTGLTDNAGLSFEVQDRAFSDGPDRLDQ
jgi:hypothetical protein